MTFFWTNATSWYSLQSESPIEFPKAFFDDTLNPAHLSARDRLYPLTTVRSRFLSLFRPIHPDAHNTPSGSRPFHWVRNRLSARTSSVDIGLPQHSSEIVDVPYTRGKPRNACARERRKPLIPKNATAGSSRPPNSTVTQQSSGAAQAQSSSQPHATDSSPTAPPAVVNTTSSTNPHATIRHAGRWTRFWLFIGCTSAEYTDGHH